jgi:hypothetical protein
VPSVSCPGITKERALRDAVGVGKGDGLTPMVPPASAFLPKLTMEQLDGTQLFKVNAPWFVSHRQRNSRKVLLVAVDRSK